MRTGRNPFYEKEFPRYVENYVHMYVYPIISTGVVGHYSKKLFIMGKIEPKMDYSKRIGTQAFDTLTPECSAFEYHKRYDLTVSINGDEASLLENILTTKLRECNKKYKDCLTNGGHWHHTNTRFELKWEIDKIEYMLEQLMLGANDLPFKIDGMLLGIYPEPAWHFLERIEERDRKNPELIGTGYNPLPPYQGLKSHCKKCFKPTLTKDNKCVVCNTEKE